MLTFLQAYQHKYKYK